MNFLSTWGIKATIGSFSINLNLRKSGVCFLTIIYVFVFLFIFLHSFNLTVQV